MDHGQEHSYLLQAEAAKILRLSERSLERFRLTGTGPRFIKAGGRRVLYRMCDIEAWLAERTFSSTSEAHAHRAST